MFPVRGNILLSGFLRFPAPSVFFCTSSLGLKGLFTNHQQMLAMKLWDTDNPLLKHCSVQIVTKQLHGCERQVLESSGRCSRTPPKGFLSCWNWDPIKPIKLQVHSVHVWGRPIPFVQAAWKDEYCCFSAEPHPAHCFWFCTAFGGGRSLKAGESWACCCLLVCCSYQLGYLSNWAVFDFMSCQICFFPFRSLRKSQVMFKLFRGTLSTTVLVWPIKLLTAVGMRTGKILTLPKSWKTSTSSCASDFLSLPQPLGVPHIQRGTGA